MLNPQDIAYLVVHCSDTPDDAALTGRDIHQMHLGFGWDGVGYHRVIGRDGVVEPGRPDYWIGAHVKGFNDVSLGVCLIGRTILPMHRCWRWKRYCAIGKQPIRQRKSSDIAILTILKKPVQILMSLPGVKNGGCSQ